MQVQAFIDQLQNYLKSGVLLPTDNVEVTVQQSNGIHVAPLETLQFDNFSVLLRDTNHHPSKVTIYVSSRNLKLKLKPRTV